MTGVQSDNSTRMANMNNSIYANSNTYRTGAGGVQLNSAQSNAAPNSENN